MSDNFRIKLFLAKSADLTEDVLLSENAFKKGLRKIPISAPSPSTLFLREVNNPSPSWFKKYLLCEEKLNLKFVEGVMFFDFSFKSMKTKVAFVFGNAETMLNTNRFVARFGLITALNLAKSIRSIRKLTLSDNMTSVRENAHQKSEFGDFSFFIDKDLLEGVTVCPQENSFSKGNMVGGVSLSFTTALSLNQIEILLESVMEAYQRTDYRKEFEFLDHISEVSDDNAILEPIHAQILNALKDGDSGNAWFSVPEDIDWEFVTDFRLLSGRATKNKIEAAEVVNDIDLDIIMDFFSRKGIPLDSWDELSMCKVLLESGREDLNNTKWTFTKCLYANVEFNQKHYVMANERLFQIDHSYYQGYEDLYKALPLADSLQPNLDKLKEKDYNIKVASDDPKRYLLLDCDPLTVHSKKFEICDLFDLNDMSFIHVKNYGSSDVLSHLFAQAYTSASLFLDTKFYPEMVQKMEKKQGGLHLPKLENKDFRVVMAIITSKPIPPDGHSKIPFFSMVNAVNTISSLKTIMKIDGKLMFIAK